MPSRAYTSFLRLENTTGWIDTYEVSMPSRAYTSFLQGMNMLPKIITDASVNALSGLYLISTDALRVEAETRKGCVNALSGLYLISTQL